MLLRSLIGFLALQLYNPQIRYNQNTFQNFGNIFYLHFESACTIIDILFANKIFTFHNI